MTHIERVIYINSNNQSVEFGVDGLYMNEIAFGWGYDANSVNGVIVGFTSGVKSFSLPASIIADSDLQANAIRDKLHDVFLYDVVKSKKGRLIYRGYTLYCNITDSKHSNYQEWTAFGDVDLTVTTDDMCWKKSSTIVYTSAGKTDSGLEDAMDYPFDYAFDYGFVLNKLSFENNSFIESDFIMKIQGEVSSPSVYINNHLYSVDATLAAGDILEINSKEHTIMLTKSDGTIENCFDLRNRDSYIFQKIAAGMNSLSSAQKLNVMLTYFDERGEPKWS